jgi:hypothetical protein
MRLDDALAAVDAVLQDASAELRSELGVLAPRAWSEGGGGDPWWQETQCLIAPTDPSARLQGKVRFLQLARRYTRGDSQARSGEEGKMHEVDVDFSLAALAAGGERTVSFRLAGGTDLSETFAYQKWPIFGAVQLSVEPFPETPRPIVRLRARVENLTAWVLPGDNRERALRGALLGAHLVLGVVGGAFVSLRDPPRWAAAAAAACRNVGTYPVLASDRDDVVLSAPIQLGEHSRGAAAQVEAS